MQEREKNNNNMQLRHGSYFEINIRKEIISFADNELICSGFHFYLESWAKVK